LDDKTVFWLNYTGSGNETSAHLLENTRMTIMFCSFGPKPLILRLYGQAKEIGMNDPGWSEWMQHFPTDTGARQIFIVDLERVQTSCGYAVPEMDLQNQRTRLLDWSDQKGPDGIAKYWEDKNRISIDGKPTKYGKEQ
ncbi:MAG: pyridoxamine 5'-phosphate oxidase family protein, partial [Bacteroidota bacterium]